VEPQQLEKLPTPTTPSKKGSEEQSQVDSQQEATWVNILDSLEISSNKVLVFREEFEYLTTN